MIVLVGFLSVLEELECWFQFHLGSVKESQGHYKMDKHSQVQDWISG